MRTIVLTGLLLVFGGRLLAAVEGATLERGRASEASACVTCHGLKIIHGQRLSKAVWDKEIDKMQRWGAIIDSREALLEYLVANFGDDKPLPLVPLTEDGSQAEKK